MTDQETTLLEDLTDFGDDVRRAMFARVPACVTLWVEVAVGGLVALALSPQGTTWAELLAPGGWLRLVSLWAITPLVVRILTPEWWRVAGPTPGVAAVLLLTLMDWTAAGRDAAAQGLVRFSVVLLCMLLFAALFNTVAAVALLLAAKVTGRGAPAVFDFASDRILRYAIFAVLALLMYAASVRLPLPASVIAVVGLLVVELVMYRREAPAVVAVRAVPAVRVRTPSPLEEGIARNRPSNSDFN